MGLYDEIFKNPSDSACARCVVVPGGGGYFEGVKSVGDFSTEKIVVYFPKQTVEVEGKNLAIKKYYDGDLQIGGRVTCVKVVCPTETGV
ncbi:MAG: YabP/YqfC family sporulation protein [Clostridia bacterium]|nr:YabP/YqfC family sporulation protein [Clostridia bacterium]